jgi:hypothetical protein
LLTSNQEHNRKLDNSDALSRIRKQKARGSWSHDGYQKEHGDTVILKDEDEDVEMEEEKQIPWSAVLTNLHWEILESDLMELFGF